MTGTRFYVERRRTYTTMSTKDAQMSRYPSLRGLIDRLHRESVAMPPQVDHFLDGKHTCNLLETESCYVVQLAIPGINPDTVHLQIATHMLTIHTRRAIPHVTCASYVWHGLPDGELTEVFALPGEVESARANATCENGILTIMLPKARNGGSVSIPVGWQSDTAGEDCAWLQDQSPIRTGPVTQPVKSPTISAKAGVCTQRPRLARSGLRAARKHNAAHRKQLGE